MSEHLVSPLGTHQFARWACYRCIWGKSGITAEQAREEAAAHVRETGHVAAVERGTRELLSGMATTSKEAA